MQSKKGFKDAGIVIGILAIILFGIIIFATANDSDGTSDSDDDDSDLENNFSTMFLDASPGILEMAGETNTSVLEIELDDFSINGIPRELTDRLSDEDEKIIIRQGVFSGSNWAKSVVANTDVVGASLIFDVETTEGEADVRVYLNGEKIASKRAKEGEVERFELPLDLVNYGVEENTTNENLIEIKVAKPSWLFFWKTNAATLKDTLFVQKVFDAEVSQKVFDLDFDSDEVIGLDTATLETEVMLSEGAGSKKLKITFQDEEVYNSVPSSSETFETDIPTTLFRNGVNTLAFETELEGGYNISGILSYDVMDMPENSFKEYKVTIGENVWPYVENGQRGEDYECIFTLSKASGDDAIKVWINNHRMEYSFVNNELDANVCNYMKEGENSIKIIAKEFIRLDRASLELKEK